MAKSPVVYLTAHRNTKRRRERKELRKEMISAARRIGCNHDLRGYVIFGIGENGAAYALWDTGKAIPLWAMPGFVADAIRADVAEYMAANSGSDDYDGSR